MSTPDLHLKTCFIFNDAGRIISTREPQPSRGPLFILVRSSSSCVWAVREDIPNDVASELDRLAREEPKIVDLRDAPLNAQRYLEFLKKPATRVSDGPAFEFPDSLAEPSDVVVVEDERLLEQNFRGWVPGEIDAGCAPVLAIVEGGHPVSICFCARRSDDAAEAGVETAAPYRGKGYASRVTAAWAMAIRNSGRVPLYSTSWTNHASLAVARKLNLVPYACSWSCYE
jgi:GNAT acetyltransferase-like protein